MVWFKVQYILKDSDGHVRACVARALGELKDPRAVEPLKALLNDPNKDVRLRAEKSLKEIEAQEPRPPQAAESVDQ